jgi:hypothetical protein
MSHWEKRLMVAVLALAGVAAATGTASAESRWDRHHPRRAEVNHRLANQNRRIRQERRDGQITAAQAHDLHAEDRGIRAQERFDASQDGGHITKGEKQQLNQEENGVSQQIGH